MHRQEAIVQSHSPSQAALTNFNFSNAGGRVHLPAGRLGNFDSFSEIGYPNYIGRPISVQKSEGNRKKVANFSKRVN